MKTIYLLIIIGLVSITAACADDHNDSSNGEHAASGHDSMPAKDGSDSHSVGADMAINQSDESNHEDAGGHGDEHGDEQSPVGTPAPTTTATKTVQVSLADDMRITFSEELGAIKSGEIIEFTVTNNGRIRHEFSIGNQQEQIKHGAMMRDMPTMTHADGNSVTLEPGQTQTLVWKFEGEDMVVFACNIPGHYEAGMFQKVALQ